MLIAHDKPNAQQLRQSTRPEHLNWVDAQDSQIRLGGPLLDETGNPIGSMIIYETENLAAAEKLIQQDPYVKAGLFGDITLTPWKMVVNKLPT